MFTHKTIAILCFGWFVVSSHADEPPKQKPVGPETITVAPRKRKSGEVAPAPTDTKPAEPTTEQLDAAEVAYAKFGATYHGIKGKQQTHLFRMPPSTTDADLKGLPGLPFQFALSLDFSQVSDPGLKELKEFKNLTILGLAGTKVTDAGLKELKGLKNLSGLSLIGTKVTGAGVKELQGALPNCAIISPRK